MPLTGVLRLPSLSLLLLASVSPAQNLVQNPGFETFTTCPTTSGQLALAPPWYSPNTQTPDYLNACSTLTPSVPVNFYGNQAAHGGQAYASAIMYGQLPATVREYCAGQLTTPLVAGRTYQVSYWVSLADRSIYAIAEVGAHFKVGPHAGPPSTPLPYTPQVQNASSNILTDKVGWTQVSGTFVASGGEDHIALGNFLDNASTTAAPVSGGSANFCIYYFDDVSVVDLTGGGCDVQIVGWSDLPLPASTGYLDVQNVDPCRPAVTNCTTLTPVRAAAPFAGGTAYDPRYGTVWVSDGVTLAEYYTGVARACRARCTPFRAVVSDPNALVSGLTCSDARPRLFQLATRPGVMELTVYDNVRCPAQPVQCRLSLPGDAVAAGLAYDEVDDLLFVSVSIPGANGYSNLLWVMPASAPCQVICETRLFTCSIELVTGLGFDACSRKLYVTDGHTTQTIDVIDARHCQLHYGPCCRKQIAPVYRGLAVVPCWEKITHGRPCTSAPCPSCPNMHSDTIGDPAIGTAFQVTLADAPAAAQAWLMLSFGPCGAGVPLPRPFCGVLYPDLGNLFFLPPVPVLGAPPCGGDASQLLPLPVNPALCGHSLCTQWLVACQGFGFGLSPALEFTIAGG